MASTPDARARAAKEAWLRVAATGVLLVVPIGFVVFVIVAVPGVWGVVPFSGWVLWLGPKFVRWARTPPDDDFDWDDD